MFVKSITYVLNTAKMSCLFHNLKLDTKNDNVKVDEVRKAYNQGKMDILCSLAEYEIISMETASYLAGLSNGLFENELQNWRDAQNME